MEYAEIWWTKQTRPTSPWTIPSNHKIKVTSRTKQRQNPKFTDNTIQETQKRKNMNRTWHEILVEEVPEMDHLLPACVTCHVTPSNQYSIQYMYYMIMVIVCFVSNPPLDRGLPSTNLPICMVTYLTCLTVNYLNHVDVWHDIEHVLYYIDWHVLHQCSFLLKVHTAM